MTGAPPWGTPTGPSPDDRPYGLQERPLPAHGRADRAAEGRGFFLLVEQLAGSGDGTTWRLDPPPVPAGPTRQAARDAALQCARTYRPHHPFSPQERAVYRVDDDTYVVIVTGRTRTFHFRVTVAELLAAT